MTAARREKKMDAPASTLWKCMFSKERTGNTAKHQEASLGSVVTSLRDGPGVSPPVTYTLNVASQGTPCSAGLCGQGQK